MFLVVMVLVGRGKYKRYTTRKGERVTDDSLQTQWLCSPLTQNPGAHILPFILWLSIDNNPIIIGKHTEFKRQISRAKLCTSHQMSLSKTHKCPAAHCHIYR